MSRERSLAAASGVTFVGAMISAASGLVLTVVLGRMLGAVGAGVVLQVIGAFTIALGVAKAGLDTTAIWLLPRSSQDDPAAVRGIVRGLLIASVSIGALVAVVLAAITPILFRHAEVAHAVSVALWFLPFAVVTTVGLAATRGLGGVGPFTLIGQIAVPGLRPVLVLAAGALGGGALAAASTWAGVLAAAVVPTLAVLGVRVRRLERAEQVRPRRLERATILHAGRFTLPRAVSSGIELAQQWLDVVLVGALAGPAAAGIYGAATRFVGAGMIPSTSMRIVVAPLFSASLHRNDHGAAQAVYRSTATWIILFSAPIYVLLWLFGGTALSLVGPAFVAGAPLLGILALGATVSFCTGNVQSVLLMSGRSGWVAINKAIVLVILVTGLVGLVPVWGVTGAAATWSVAAAADALLAAVQVRRKVGIRLELGRVMLGLLVGAVPFVAAGSAGRWWFGDRPAGFLVGASMGLVLFAAVAWAARRQLDLGGALQLVRRRRGGPAAGKENG